MMYDTTPSNMIFLLPSRMCWVPGPHDPATSDRPEGLTEAEVMEPSKNHLKKTKFSGSWSILGSVRNRYCICNLCNLFWFCGNGPIVVVWLITHKSRDSGTQDSCPMYFLQMYVLWLQPRWFGGSPAMSEKVWQDGSSWECSQSFSLGEDELTAGNEKSKGHVTQDSK